MAKIPNDPFKPEHRYAQQQRTPEAEYIGRGKGWVGQGSAAHGPGMVLASSWDVPWADWRGHLKDNLGYSVRNGDQLNRVLPRQHPHVTHLRATRLTGIEGVRWAGKSGGPVAGEASDYERARLTYSFESLPYDLKENGSIAGEWERYVIKRSKPVTDVLSLNDQAWKYVEGPLSGSQTSFAAKLGWIVTKVRLQWTWVQVPAAYIMNVDGLPVNLIAGVGCVNDAAFAGYYNGTLLFESYDLEPRMDPTDAAGDAAEGKVPRTFDVTLHFTFSEPPTDETVTDAGNGTNRGHNIVMSTKGVAYAIGLEKSTTTRMFRTYDFRKLFQGVPLPAA